MALHNPQVSRIHTFTVYSVTYVCKYVCTTLYFFVVLLIGHMIYMRKIKLILYSYIHTYIHTYIHAYIHAYAAGEGHIGISSDSRDRLVSCSGDAICDDASPQTQPHLSNAQVRLTSGCYYCIPYIVVRTCIHVLFYNTW
jgi:hypothetical protein